MTWGTSKDGIPVAPRFPKPAEDAHMQSAIFSLSLSSFWMNFEELVDEKRDTNEFMVGGPSEPRRSDG